MGAHSLISTLRPTDMRPGARHENTSKDPHVMTAATRRVVTARVSGPGCQSRSLGSSPSWCAVEDVLGHLVCSIKYARVQGAEQHRREESAEGAAATKGTARIDQATASLVAFCTASNEIVAVRQRKQGSPTAAFLLKIATSAHSASSRSSSQSVITHRKAGRIGSKVYKLK